VVRTKILMHYASLLLVSFLLAACFGGKTIIHSDPPRACIAINGVNYGVTPLEVNLDCDENDSFEVTASAPGYLSKTEALSCRMLRGAKKNVFLELEPGVDSAASSASPLPSPPGAQGTLEVRSVPDQAEVYVNDELSGTTPLTNQKLNSGDYTVELRKEGFKSEKKTAHITPGSKESLFVILEME